MKINFSNGEKKDLKAVWIDQDSIEVFFVDQRALPKDIKILKSDTVEKTAEFIRSMVIRGAPSIGIAGAYGFVQSVKSAYSIKLNQKPKKFYQHLEKDSKKLLQTRPTAIDLQNNINRMLSIWNPEIGAKPPSISDYLCKALNLEKNLLEECKNIAETGFSLLKDGYSIITHCHTGAFATVDIGSALSPMKLAHERGYKIHVYVDETRPRLQGGKLTAWELDESGVPYTLITDSTAASLMKENKIDIAIVGADRIAANGDIANKIGTYNLSIISKFHEVPLYIAVPWSTFHLGISTGKDIPIEQRSSREITHLKLKNSHEVPITFETSSVYNPAFDITPNELLTGIIVPGEILYPPFKEAISKKVKNIDFN